MEFFSSVWFGRGFVIEFIFFNVLRGERMVSKIFFLEGRVVGRVRVIIFGGKGRVRGFARGRWAVGRTDVGFGFFRWFFSSGVVSS